MPIILVAAVAENGVIGRGNGLPWRLKSDMQHFRALTMGKPVIMGRKTYLSIGKPLKGRTTIVVSRDRTFAAPGIVVAPSLEAALAAARGDALRRGADAIVVAGGADIYAQAMPLADASRHHPRAHSASTAMRVFRPSIRRRGMKSRAASTSRPAEDEAPFAFVTYAACDAPL